MNREDEDTCKECGRWTDKGRAKIREHNKLHPIYGVDFSKPLSETIEGIRIELSNLRGKLCDIRMAGLWGDRVECVEGLLTCGLIALYNVKEEMEKVEKKDLTYSG